MATVTDSDLKEIKDILTDIKVSQGKIEAQITGIDKRLDVIEARVNGLTGWLIGVLLALVGGLLGLLGKIAFFPNP
jgi:tetrahydromethanopterin S-methyltransferase subunit F